MVIINLHHTQFVAMRMLPAALQLKHYLQ